MFQFTCCPKRLGRWLFTVRPEYVARTSLLPNYRTNTYVIVNINQEKREAEDEIGGLLLLRYFPGQR